MEQTLQIAQGRWSLEGPFCRKLQNTQPEPVLLYMSLVGFCSDSKHTLVCSGGSMHVLWWKNASSWWIHLIIYSQKKNFEFFKKHCYVTDPTDLQNTDRICFSHAAWFQALVSLHTNQVSVSQEKKHKQKTKKDVSMATTIDKTRVCWV